jgi:AraC-like DNA-binding protein
MNIQKFFPSDFLAPFIKEYILIESDVDTESKTIPDTFFVMSFRYKGKVSKIKNGEEELLPFAVIAGLRKSARLFRYSKDTANLLVVFKECGIAAFHKIPVYQLFEHNVSSDNLFNSYELEEVTERLAESTTNYERIAIVESFFFKRLKFNSNDLLVEKAVDVIRQKRGIIRIKELSSDLCISTDAFEKRFRAKVGATPKQYASIVRVRSFIKNYSSYSSLTQACYEAGYFDQAHFIKEFKQFTDQSPKAFFKSSIYW